MNPICPGFGVSVIVLYGTWGIRLQNYSDDGIAGFATREKHRPVQFFRLMYA